MASQAPAAPIDPYGRDQFDLPLDQIPLTTDRIPYKQLGALGRYQGQTLPDTAPPVLAELFASTSTFVGDLLSTDGQRNLNVNLAAGGSSAGGVGTAGYNRVANAVNIIVTDGTTQTFANFPLAKNVAAIVWSAALKVLTVAGTSATIQLDLTDGAGANMHVDLFCGSAVGNTFYHYLQFIPLLVPNLTGLVSGSMNVVFKATGGDWFFSYTMLQLA